MKFVFRIPYAPVVVPLSLCNPTCVPNDSLQLFWSTRYVNFPRGFRFLSEDNEVICDFFSLESTQVTVRSPYSLVKAS